MGQARVKDMIRARDETIALLNQLTDEVIVELDRRMRFTSKPDGFSKGNSGEPGSGKGDHADPTFVQAATLVEGYDEDKDDPQGAAFKRLRDAQSSGYTSATVIVGAVALIQHVQRSGEGDALLPPGQGTCVCCEKWCKGSENNRLKSKLCPACHSAWNRWKSVSGNTERAEFEKQHKAKLALRGTKVRTHA